MTEDDLAPTPRHAPGAGDQLREHEVRTALLELLAEVGAVTATEAAGRLGYSSGLCSFHLRQLARHGRIEEAPHTGGRARPWRLRREPRAAGTSPAQSGASHAEFGALARGLEDESWQRWLAQRDLAPDAWRQEEAFSAVAYLTPEEMTRVADAVRRALAPYQDREQRPLARPEGARPVALITRLFPLLPHGTDEGERGLDGRPDATS
ncbi:ArsR/SmtB family transcription factor [Streptomyces reniochalinae]|uniref:ArsR family transcriptional regulator n=1 Tax=Streptomyces reniochalinae TaxID=2250578 RepID=A0A367EG96_9ACTN|nr:winged helix-turn-helix domain-containing protein [Streptomyces reniochalinae]RCG17071.1 ArsR family transcriptional regulator [Streptomyces reniochalinae]